MAFNFFKKNDSSPAPTKSVTDEEPGLSFEDLERVDGGYKKTQDDINKILGESEYIQEKKRSELDEMFEQQSSKSKGYTK